MSGSDSDGEWEVVDAEDADDTEAWEVVNTDAEHVGEGAGAAGSAAGSVLKRTTIIAGAATHLLLGGSQERQRKDGVVDVEQQLTALKATGDAFYLIVVPTNGAAAVSTLPDRVPRGRNGWQSPVVGKTVFSDLAIVQAVLTPGSTTKWLNGLNGYKVACVLECYGSAERSVELLGKKSALTLPQLVKQQYSVEEFLTLEPASSATCRR